MILLLLVAGISARWYRDSMTQRAAAMEQVLNQVRSQVETAQQALAAVRVPPDKDEQLLKLRQEVADREQILTLLEQGMPQEGLGFADYFRGLARQSVPGLWLVGFNVEAGGKGLEIRGRMVEQALLPEYIRRLNREPVFSGSEFAALDVRQPSFVGRSDAISTRSAPPTSEVEKTPGYVEFVLKPLRKDVSGVKSETGGKDDKGNSQ
jgi:type II secretory pathway pseudopilin PulG